MISDQPGNFNALYHISRGGELNQNASAWPALFDSLADRIIMDLRPASVLDAGCARGYLVRALRQRGMEAWGVDASDNTIQNALPEIQPYCQVGSILEPFAHSHYDLIICIDCLEYVSPEVALQAVENLCAHSDDILLSCAPIDFGDYATVNAQPPEYWVALFNRYGFIHDLNFDASFIAPWAMRLRKTHLSVSDLLFNYEKKLWLLTQENDLRRNQGVEQLLELSYKESQHQNQINIFNQREQFWKETNDQAQADIQFWKATNAQSQADLNAVLNSTSWRFMTRVHRLRLKFIPIGTGREAAMRSVFRGIKAFRREGPVSFFVLAFQKLKRMIELNNIKFRNKLKLRSSNSPDVIQVCEIESLVIRPEILPHTAEIDIIICVHNALDDLQRCLTSLLENTTQPYHLILVDDGSSELTAQYLREFADAHHASLLRSEEATGYPCAANRGMRASSAEFLVLVNSDTILTPEWLDRFVACIQSDDKFGIVGPLSNTASWQSVPKIEDNGDWASNPLPEGMSPSRMAQWIALHSARQYLEMPLLNGFFMMIRRKLLDEVGLFDEENFGQGYGEEDDLVLRARKLGWKMALADDVYIYHAQSKSYSSDKRHVLSEHAGKILREKHGESIISQGVRFCLQDLVLEGIRARAEVTYPRDQCLRQIRQYSGRKLLFVLPINSPGGGANVIRSECIALQQMGVNVSFFNLTAHRDSFTKSYPDLSLFTTFGNVEDLETTALDYDAVIATFNPTVSWLKPLLSKPTYPILGYYVQGFEPWMYTQGSQGYKTALDSYTLIDDMILFTKTEWTRQQVRQATGRESEVIGASVDIDLYRPRPRNAPQWPEGPIRIAAMIRPESPYREPLKTMQLLRETALKYKGEVEILLFGTPYENSAFQELPHDFSLKLFGVLNPEQVANLLSQADIFIDYSSHQAMGLTAMEAMACGCAAMVPQYGGASSYAVHEQNSLLIDMSSFENVWIAMQRLIDDEKLRDHLRHKAIHDICAYFPEQAAMNMLKVLFKR